MTEENRRTWRAVESRDPSLDAATNAEITAELRDAVGADRVLVSAGTPDHRAVAHRRRSPLLAPLSAMSLGLLTAALVVIVVAGVWGVVAAGPWALVVLLVALAASCLGLTAVVLSMADETEHLAPDVVAELEAHGDVHPDRAFNDLADELRS